MTSAPTKPIDPIKSCTVPLLKPVPQMEFDWQIGHTRPWLKVAEIAAAIHISEDHVVNLIEDGSLDYAIDIRTATAGRAAFRVLRESFFRFICRKLNPASTDVEQALNPYFKNLSSVLSSWQVAAHLRCTDDHVLHLAEFFTNVASADSGRKYLRVAKPQLFEFIKKRRIT